MITVGQLAEQLGITLKEAVALCVVAGVKVQGADTTLAPADVARVHDILQGRVNLPDPRLTAPKKKIGERSRKTSSVGSVLAIGAISLLAIGGILVVYLVFGRGDTRVLRAQPGECFDAEVLLGVSVIPSSVKVVPCDGPHGYKAFGTIDLDASYKEFPGFEQVKKHAEERCPALAGATGVSGNKSLFLGPADERAWKDETAHKIVCAAPEAAFNPQAPPPSVPVSKK